MIKKFFFLFFAFIFSMSVFAAADPDAPAGNACDDNALVFATGPVKKGYSKLYANVEKVCGKEVKMCELNTKGGLDNVTALSTKDASIGFAQLDTAKLLTSDDAIASLEQVFALNTNYLHTVVSSSGFNVDGPKKMKFFSGDKVNIKILNFSQLRGMHVVAVGSAVAMISQIDKQLGFKMNITTAPSDKAAFDQVRSGEAAAAFTSAGWPHGELKDLPANSGLSLAAFDVTLTGPYVVKGLNYKSMGVYNVNTIGSQNVLFTRPFRGEAANQVATLKNCIAKNLSNLKDGNFEPGWNEIKSLDAPVDWPNKFQGAAKKK